jgi:hypothetical protein
VEKERRCDVDGNFTSAQYTLIQQMIEATNNAQRLDGLIADEEYVDDAIRGVENSMADCCDLRGTQNDLEALEDRVRGLEEG